MAGKTAPAFQSAKVRFSTLTIAYDDGLEPNSIPAASTFSLDVGSVVGVAPSSVAVEVAGGVPQVSLTLANPVGYSQTVSVTYTKPATNPLQNRAGFDVPNLSGQSVDNEIGPGLTSAAVGGSTLVLTYGPAVDTASVPTAGDFHASFAGAQVTPTGVEVSSTTVTLILPSIVVSSVTLTVSYAPGENPIQDAANMYAAAALNRESVTNNHAAGDGCAGPSEGGGDGHDPDLQRAARHDPGPRGWRLHGDGERRRHRGEQRGGQRQLGDADPGGGHDARPDCAGRLPPPGRTRSRTWPTTTRPPSATCR